MSADRGAPFVVDRWVRGEEFHGRGAQVTEILDGPRDSLWIVGTGRIGKTSLLRHVELLAERSSEADDLPLYWDLRGVDDVADLSRRFRDTLSVAEARLGRVGLEPGDLESRDLFASIGRARRRLRSRGRRLLLLCDGAEELMRLSAPEPVLLRKLRRTLQSGEDLRTVLASTPELWALTGQKADTSPFLHGFVPPLPLPPLSREEALGLLRQARLPPETRPTIDDATAERMQESAGGHPYLLQELGRLFFERGNLDEAVEHLTHDPSIGSLFSSDLDTLPRADRAVLAALAETDAADRGRLPAQVSLDASALKASLFRLESLGLVRREGPAGLTLGNLFLRRWLAARGPHEPGLPANARATEIVADLSRAEGPETLSSDDLFEAVYDPLRRLAGHYLRHERPGHTLQPTALVHEAYLKLIDQSRVDWKGRSHFFAVGARAMRRILIDHARTRRRAKRGGDWLRVTLTGLAGSPLSGDLDPTQLLELHAALEKLAELDERQARVVELRYFAGLKMTEVAEVLGVSKRTADSDWAKARAWLEQELAG
jgi:RNA polymerase sigma factor (TIGR02999 family)